MLEKVLRKRERLNRDILNKDCIQHLMLLGEKSAKLKATSQDDSDEEPESHLIYVSNLPNIHKFNDKKIYNSNRLYPHRA